MATKPSIIIPVTIDGKEALELLAKIGQAGKESGKEVEEGAEGATLSIGNMVGEMTKFIGLQEGMAGIKQVVGAIQESMREASKFIRESAEKFEALAATMRGMAALEGRLPSDVYAREQIDLAEQRTRTLSTAELVAGKTAFQQYGSAYVGKADAAGQLPQGVRVEQKTIDQVLPEIMDYAKLRGLSVPLAMQLFTSIIQKMPPGTAPEKYKEVFTKLMDTSEFSRGSAEASVSQLIPTISAMVGEGKAFGGGEEGILKAGVAIGLGQETRMGESAQYLRDLNQMVEHLRKPDKTGRSKADALGIEELDDPIAIARKIGEKYQAAKQAGDVQTFKQFWRPYMGGHGGLQGAEELETLIEGIQSGKEASMFANQQKAEKMEEDIKHRAAADVGRRLTQRRDIEIAAERKGAEYVPATEALATAEAQVIASGDLDRPSGISAVGRGIQGIVEGKSRRQLLIEERARQNTQAAAEAAGAASALLPDPRYVGFGGPAPGAPSLGVPTVEGNIVRLHRETVDALRRQPLTAPPAQPAARAGGQ